MQSNEFKLEQLEDWVGERSFDELTPAEQAFVIREFSEEKYRRMSAILKDINTEASIPLWPASEIETSLEKHLSGYRLVQPFALFYYTRSQPGRP